MAKWRRLENAAKIFPATSGKRDSRVFRFACELKEDVKKELLQEALDRAIKEMPLFQSVLRKGLFWFYLENSEIRPVVTEEHRLPCSNIYIRDKRNLLFEVSYFKKRINFEVFHVLTDGTGAMLFLKCLVSHYLVLCHPEELKDKGLISHYDATEKEKEDDGFQKYYNIVQGKRKLENIHAYQLTGIKNGEEKFQIIEGVLSVSSLLKKAREQCVTMTVYLTSVFLCAIHKEMSKRQEKRPVVLMVPVNLRKYFPSESCRNFFGWIDVGYQFHGEDSFEDVLKSVKEFFERELTKEHLSMRMNDLISLEQNPFLRITPLGVKNLFMMVANRISERRETAIFSNMGAVNLPEEFTPYIRLFNVFTSTPKLELCMCSYHDNLVLSFSSYFKNSNIERNFFRQLTELGIEVEISAKLYE